MNVDRPSRFLSALENAQGTLTAYRASRGVPKERAWELHTSALVDLDKALWPAQVAIDEDAVRAVVRARLARIVEIGSDADAVAAAEQLRHWIGV